MGQQHEPLITFAYAKGSEAGTQRTCIFSPGVDLDRLVLAAIGGSSHPASPSTSLSRGLGVSDKVLESEETQPGTRDLILSQIRNVSKKRHSSFSLGNLPIPLEEGET